MSLHHLPAQSHRPRVPLVAFAAVFSTILALFQLGCETGGPGGASSSKTLLLYNPFSLADIPAEAAGHAPYFHGEANGFALTAMEPVGDCGWYSVNVPEKPGDFRFYGSSWDGPQWGSRGLDSELNMNADGVFGTADTVYAVPDASSGVTDFFTEQPFDCATDQAPTVVNPFTQGSLPSAAREAHVDPLLSIWLTNFYEEEGDMARVRFDDPALTVSEGIGYGMLIIVYSDLEDAQARFDKLLAYYDAFLAESGLMHWQVSGFSSVAQSGAASDADLDVATALILAARRFADPKYQTRALQVVDALRTHVFDAAGYLKSGDLWADGQALNPSYFSFVAFQLFSEVDTANASFWLEVLARHYALIEGGKNASTGLIANWTDPTGAAMSPPTSTPYPGWGDFGFDAIRVPWRAAWAHLWYGDRAEHASAQGIASDICEFAVSASEGDPASLVDQYALDGAPLSETAGPGIVGSYSCACTANTGQQAFLDASFGTMRSKTASYDVTYYQTSLQVLEALLLTGRMRP